MCKLCYALLQNLGKFFIGHFLVAENLFVVRHSDLGKFLGAHSLDVLAVEPAQLVVVENGRGFAYSADVKRLLKLRKGENLLIVLRTPAEQGDVIDDRLRKISVLNQIVKACRAVAF